MRKANEEALIKLVEAIAADAIELQIDLGMIYEEIRAKVLTTLENMALRNRENQVRATL